MLHQFSPAVPTHGRRPFRTNHQQRRRLAGQGAQQQAAIERGFAAFFGWSAAEHAAVEHLFAAEGIEPSQVESRRQESPEIHLLWAILIDALLCVLPRLVHKRERTAAQREAWEWIESDSRSYFCSYVRICEAVGQDAGRLRAAVQQLRRAEEQRRQQVATVVAQSARRRAAGPSARPQAAGL